MVLNFKDFFVQMSKSVTSLHFESVWYRPTLKRFFPISLIGSVTKRVWLVQMPLEWFRKLNGIWYRLPCFMIHESGDVGSIGFLAPQVLLIIIIIEQECIEFSVLNICGMNSLNGSSFSEDVSSNWYVNLSLMSRGVF